MRSSRARAADAEDQVSLSLHSILMQRQSVMWTSYMTIAKIQMVEMSSVIAEVTYRPFAQSEGTAEWAAVEARCTAVAGLAGLAMWAV